MKLIIIILYILGTYTEAILKMEKLPEKNFDYTTDYTSDIEDDKDNHNLKKKSYKRREPYTTSMWIKW